MKSANNENKYRNHAMKETYRVLSILLPIIGVMVGVAKIVGIDIEVYVFQTSGVDAWFRVLVGFIQLACGLMLFMPRLLMWGVYVGVGSFIVMISLMLHGKLFLLIPAPFFGILLLVGLGYLHQQLFHKDIVN